MDRRRRGYDGAASGTGRGLTGVYGPKSSRPPSASQLRLDEDLNAVITWVPPVSGPVTGPLAGLTVGVKDNIDVAGVRSTCASNFFADRVADRDAAVVRQLRAAGADIVATLNLAEFAVGVTSGNSAAGAPRNPWDLRRVPGGSSGGSGAAVAAGLVDLALGTDSGGSVRLPASACGVTGLRPTPGVLDTTGIFPVSPDFDTVGPMARSVDLVARVFEVLADHPQDSASRRVVVGVPHWFVTDDVDPAIRDAVARFTAQLKSMNMDVIDIDLHRTEQAQDYVYALLYSDLAELHAERMATEPHRFQPATLERIRLGLHINADQRRVARSGRHEFQVSLRRIFQQVDVIITPTLPVDVPWVGGGESVITQSRRIGQLSYPWSLHDGPTLSLPVGFHPNSGMPIGAQLTSASGDESALFTVGRAYQAVTDWHQHLPPTTA